MIRAGMPTPGELRENDPVMMWGTKGTNPNSHEIERERWSRRLALVAQTTTIVSIVINTLLKTLLPHSENRDIKNGQVILLVVQPILSLGSEITRWTLAVLETLLPLLVAVVCVTILLTVGTSHCTGTATTTVDE